MTRYETLMEIDAKNKERMRAKQKTQRAERAQRRQDRQRLTRLVPQASVRLHIRKLQKAKAQKAWLKREREIKKFKEHFTMEHSGHYVEVPWQG